MTSDSFDRIIDESKLKMSADSLQITRSLIQSASELDKSALESEISSQLTGLKEEMEMVKQRIESRQRSFRRQRQILDAEVKCALDKEADTKPIRPAATTIQKNQGRRHEKPNQANVQKNTQSDRAQTKERHTNAAHFNIWQRVDQFFKPVPSDAEIDQLFGDRLAGITVPDIPDGVHWSQRFSVIVKKAKGKALLPPGPGVVDGDVSKYWENNPPAFQLEDMQLRNRSLLHCLLSALVEAKPEELTPEEREKRRREDSFVRSHILLPSVEFDPYLCHGFDTRLRLELESAGLDKYDGELDHMNNEFEAEIKDLKEQVETELKPELERLHREVEDALPRIRENQAKQANHAAIYRAMVAELTLKKKKRA